eukprot:gene7468-biopygen1509
MVAWTSVDKGSGKTTWPVHIMAIPRRQQSTSSRKPTWPKRTLAKYGQILSGIHLANPVIWTRWTRGLAKPLGQSTSCQIHVVKSPRRQNIHLANPERWPSVDKCSLETTWPLQRTSVNDKPGRVSCRAPDRCAALVGGSDSSGLVGGSDASGTLVHDLCGRYRARAPRAPTGCRCCVVTCGAPVPKEVHPALRWAARIDTAVQSRQKCCHRSVAPLFAGRNQAAAAAAAAAVAAAAAAAAVAAAASAAVAAAASAAVAAAAAAAAAPGRRARVTKSSKVAFDCCSYGIRDTYPSGTHIPVPWDTYPCSLGHIWVPPNNNAIKT